MKTLFTLAILLFAPLARGQDIPQFEGPAPKAEPPAPPPPPEPPHARFGEAGETMIGGDTAGALAFTSYDGSDAKTKSGGFALDVRHFVARDFALGIYLQASASETHLYGADGSIVRTRRDLFSGGITVGYNFALDDAISFFPGLVLGLHRSHQSIAVESGASRSISASASGADDVVHTGPWVQLVLPLLIHPVPHFFIGIGPSLYRDTAAEISGAGVSGRRASIGIDFQVGGWWGGPHVDAPVPRSGRRFGDQDVFVLTNEIGIGAGYSWYSGTDGWDAGVSIAPGFDFFVAPHVSMGAVLHFSHTATVGSSDNGQVKETTDSVGIGPRIGADLPITEWLSAYLRGGLLFARHSFSESTARAENSLSYGGTRVFASLHALVHATSHFFVGLGPAIGHDLSSQDQYDRSNRQTAVSVSALVGGWL